MNYFAASRTQAFFSYGAHHDNNEFSHEGIGVAMGRIRSFSIQGIEL